LRVVSKVAKRNSPLAPSCTQTTVLYLPRSMARMGTVDAAVAPVFVVDSFGGGYVDDKPLTEAARCATHGCGSYWCWLPAGSSVSWPRCSDPSDHCQTRYRAGRRSPPLKLTRPQRSMRNSQARPCSRT